MDTLDRKTLLRRGLLAGGGLAALGPLHTLGAQVAHGARPPRVPGYGPLVNKGDLWLPEDFNYAVIQRQGEPMSDGTSCRASSTAWPPIAASAGRPS